MIINGGTLSRYAMFRELPVENQTLTDPVGAVRFLNFRPVSIPVIFRILTASMHSSEQNIACLLSALSSVTLKILGEIVNSDSISRHAIYLILPN